MSQVHLSQEARLTLRKIATNQALDSEASMQSVTAQTIGRIRYKVFHFISMCSMHPLLYEFPPNQIGSSQKYTAGM